MPPTKKTPAKTTRPTEPTQQVDELDARAAAASEPPPARPRTITLTTDVLTSFAEEFDRAASLDDVADAAGIDREQLRAANIGVLDAEAAARGHDHSDNGRLLFAGTVLTLPQDGG